MENEKCENCTYYGRAADAPQTVGKSCMYHYLIGSISSEEPLPCKDYTNDDAQEEIDWGEPVGKEIW